MSYVPVTGSDVVAVTYPRMSWGAIVAGWLVATAVAGLLYVAGLALGFAAFDAHDAASTAKGIGIGTGLWFVLVWAAALFVGAMFASWFDNQADHTMGAVQGVAVWGLSLTATALWLALGFAHVAQGGAMAAAHGNGHGDMGATSTMANDEVALLHAQVERAFPGERGGNDPADAITAALLAGHDDTVRRLVVARAATPAEADLVLQRFRPSADAARAALRDQADKVAHYTSMTLWIAFVSGLLALVAATLGGWVGAGHIHRVFHLRRYDGRTTITR
jgi:hypothetical protein